MLHCGINQLCDKFYLLLYWQQADTCANLLLFCQSLKELEEENEMLRKQVQTLESAKVSPLTSILHEVTVSHFDLTK